MAGNAHRIEIPRNRGRRLQSEFVRLLSLQAHRETDRFFAASGVQLAQSASGLFHFRRAAFAQQFKSRVGLALAKAAALRITLTLDGAPITSKSHTHPSHSQTSRLLTSSLSLGALSINNKQWKSRDAQRTSWRIAINKGIQQQMGSMHGRLDLYWLSVLTIGSEGLVILSRQRRPDETIFVLCPFPDVRCR
jgi:hypothetical protein